jgi:Excalibur calcium-binding domain
VGQEGTQNQYKDQAASKVQQRSSARAPASRQALALLALDAPSDSLTTRSSRYWRPRRRYEDVCLAVAVRRVQRDGLLSTTDADWAEPLVRARLLAWTRLDLAHQAEELERSSSWLLPGMRRKAEERARERFKTIAAQASGKVPAELLRAAQVSPAESAPRQPTLAPIALRAVASAPAARQHGDRAKRLHDALGSSAVVPGQREPLARLRFERAVAPRRTARALAILVGLVVLLGLAGLSFRTSTGDEVGPSATGSGGAKGGIGSARAPAAAPAWIHAAPTAELTAHGEQGDALTPVRTEPLWFTLTAWVEPTVAHDRDCSDFNSQRQAHRWFRQHHPRRDLSGLDGDHDGRACESRPCPCSRHRVRRGRDGPGRNARPSEQAPGLVADESVPTGSTATSPTSTGTTGTDITSATSVPTSRGSTPSLAPTLGTSVTQSVRSVDRAVSRAGGQTSLSQTTGGLTGRLGRGG